MAREQLNGRAPENSNVVRTLLTTPRIFRGWVNIIKVTPGYETLNNTVNLIVVLIIIYGIGTQ